MTMNLKRFKQVATRMIECGSPFLAVGGAGIGKTEVIKQAAAAAKQSLYYLHLPIHDPTDFKGVPMGLVKPDGTVECDFYPADEMLFMQHADEPCVVFADDIGQTPNSVQAAWMQVMHERRLSGKTISPHITFVAATNRRKDKAGVQGLITPLLDRQEFVLHLNVASDPWIEWGVQNGMPTWLTAFVRARPDLLIEAKPNQDMKKSFSPRSAAALGRRFHDETGAFDILRDKDMVQACIDEGTAGILHQFMRMMEHMVSPDEVIAHPTTVEIPEEADIRFGLMSALSARFDDRTTKPIFTFLNRFEDREFVMYCVRDALQRDRGLEKSKEYMQWASDNRDLLEVGSE